MPLQYEILITLIALLLIPLIAPVASSRSSFESRLEKLMYKRLHPAGYCVRRLNGSHVFGCGSSGSGQVIRLEEHPLVSCPSFDFIAMLSYYNFHHEAFHRSLVNCRFLRGIALYDVAYLKRAVSDDGFCPNSGFFDLYNDDDEQRSNCKQRKWNPPGSGYLFNYYPYPVFLLNQEDVELVTRCCDQHGHKCHMDFRKKMFAVGNSQICFRRSTVKYSLDLDVNSISNMICAPVGDKNIETDAFDSSVTAINDGNQNRSLLLVTRMDKQNLFPQIASGYGSPVSGLIVSLAVVERIRHSFPPSHVKYVIFSGEANEYSGSTRYLFDKSKLEDSWFKDGSFEILEFGQFAHSDSIYMHVDPVSMRGNITVRNITADLKRIFSIDRRFKDVTLDDTDQPLPPCSLHVFLRHFRVPHMLMTDHAHEYANIHFHSHHDHPEQNLDKIGEQLSEHVEAIASAIARWKGVELKPASPKNDRLVRGMLSCMMESMNCSLLRDLTSAQGLPYNMEYLNRPMRFSQCNEPGEPMHLDTEMLGLLVEYVSSDPAMASKDKQECALLNGSHFLVDSDDKLSTCLYCPSIIYTDAQSPAFTSDGMKQIDGDRKWPMWTESYEGDLSALLYLSSDASVVVCYITGISLVIATLIAVRITSRLIGNMRVVVEHAQVPSTAL